MPLLIMPVAAAAAGCVLASTVRCQGGQVNVTVARNHDTVGRPV